MSTSQFVEADYMISFSMSTLECCYLLLSQMWLQGEKLLWLCVHQLTPESFCISVHSLFSWGCGHDDVCSVLPAIMENLMEFRTEACSEAAQQGLLVWLLKRIKVSPLLPHLHRHFLCAKSLWYVREAQSVLHHAERYVVSVKLSVLHHDERCVV